MSTPSCPECHAGKCRNCDGWSWDNDADDFAPCPCARGGHDDTAELQHAIDCPGPDVWVTTGISKVLLRCRACGAETFAPKTRTTT